MSPEQVDTLGNYKKADVEKPFDPRTFKDLVGKDVAEDVVRILQQTCGGLAQAVDQYHEMEENKRKSSASKVEVQAGLEDGEVAIPLGDMGDRKAILERDQYFDKRQRSWKLKKTTKLGDPKGLGRYVLFVRRFYSEKMVFSHIVIQVKGPVLRNALRNIFRGAEGFELTEEESVELQDTRFFYWARPELELLEQHYQSVGNTSSLFEIRAGLQFIHMEWAATTSALQSLLPSSITFEYLWAVLPPDCLVVDKDRLDGAIIWRARSCEKRWTKEGNIYFAIEAEQIDWDGVKMGIVETTLKIDAFAGTVAMDDLPYVPLRYHARRTALIQRVRDRSEKKLEYCIRGFQIREHKGLGLTVRHGVYKHYIEGRIVVDPKMMIRHCGPGQEDPPNPLVPSLTKLPRNRASRVWLSDLINDEKTILDELLKAHSIEVSNAPGSGHYDSDCDSIEYLTESDSSESVAFKTQPKQKQTVRITLTEEETLLLSGLVLGYCLSDAEWGAFSVDRISEVRWDDTIFQSLVMKQSLKDSILRLIKAHGSRSSGFDDFVKGKGQGLIGLLMGPPGSGKTLTAEAIAETAHMPLYVVSSGALGSESVEIYRNLTKILELATHWRAVLLLDEADVFLARRDPTDLKRNAIVSVFLRELEYYQGILILTTNQAQIFDAAFRSRIHFCHQYQDLDVAARAEIWLNFLKRVKKSAQGITVAVDEAGIQQLANMALNGRQIKNAMSIAVNLATTDETRTITAESIAVTAEALQNFNFETEENFNSPKPSGGRNEQPSTGGFSSPARLEFTVGSPPMFVKKTPPPRPPPPGSKPKISM